MMTAANETVIVSGTGSAIRAEEPEWATADRQIIKSTAGVRPDEEFNREEIQK